VNRFACSLVNLLDNMASLKAASQDLTLSFYSGMHVGCYEENRAKRTTQAEALLTILGSNPASLNLHHWTHDLRSSPFGHSPATQWSHAVCLACTTQVAFVSLVHPGNAPVHAAGATGLQVAGTIIRLFNQRAS
jgi:hypothetical protein